MTLDEFLKKYPWDPQWTALGKPMDFLWQFEVGVSVETIWPRLIDTSSFNRRLGLPEITFTERSGRLHGTATNAGFKLEWDEVPWDWEYGQGLNSARIYSKGFGRYVRARYVIEELAADRVRVIVYFGWIPRNLVGRAILAAGMGAIEGHYRRVLKEIETECRVAALPTPAVTRPLPETAKQKVDQVEASLVKVGMDPLLVRKVLFFVESADDKDLLRIRIRPLARQWEVDRRTLLSLFLHATRQGLFVLTWDVICPHCRGVRSELLHLGDVPKRDLCEACGIDFETTGLAALEVTFHVHPSVRKVARRMYCAAEPAMKPHIRIRETLPAGELRMLKTRVGPGTYRMRTQIGTSIVPAPNGQTFTLVDLDDSHEEDIADWTVESFGGHLSLKPFSKFLLQNTLDEAVTFILEESRQDTDALRPTDLFMFQDFRDLFSQEAVASDVQLDIGTQSILFTDVIGSTRYYETAGDSVAFAKVRAHFIRTYELVRAHRGTIVKTIGDAVMAAFEDPLDGLRAAMELQSWFSAARPDEDLRLRVTLHQGPCLAVRLDANIDYFGSTVNMASKLQQVARAEQVVCTDTIVLDGDVAKFLADSGTASEEDEYQTPWSQRAVRIYRVTPPVSIFSATGATIGP